jgi:ammonium transporter, Amt family
MNLVPGLSLRVDMEEEEVGLDEAQIGEFAYDYVELRREFSDVILGVERSGSEGGASVKGVGIGVAGNEKSEIPIEQV